MVMKVGLYAVEKSTLGSKLSTEIGLGRKSIVKDVMISGRVPKGDKMLSDKWIGDWINDPDKLDKITLEQVIEDLVIMVERPEEFFDGIVEASFVASEKLGMDVSLLLGKVYIKVNTLNFMRGGNG